MSLIAHLSDPHILEHDFARRPSAHRRRLAYVSMPRPLEPAIRLARLRDSLAAARAAGADHVVLTGDLTEDGLPSQFELLADALAAGGVEPSRITIVPGNHDLYDRADAFQKALAGPLRAFAATSGPGSSTNLGDATVYPFSSAIFQPYVASAGELAAADVGRLERAIADRRDPHHALVFAMHHPPTPHRFAVMQWFDGMRNHEQVAGLVGQRRNAYVLHGHIHRALDAPAFVGGPMQVFACPAAVDGGAPVRFYRVSDGTLEPIDVSSRAGPESVRVRLYRPVPSQRELDTPPISISKLSLT